MFTLSNRINTRIKTIIICLLYERLGHPNGHLKRQAIYSLLTITMKRAKTPSKHTRLHECNHYFSIIVFIIHFALTMLENTHFIIGNQNRL